MLMRQFQATLGARVGFGFAAVLLLMAGLAAFVIGQPGAAGGGAARDGRAWMVALSVTALLAAALVAWLTTRSLTRPVRALVDLAWRVAGGDLSLAVVRDRRDELGDLQQAVAYMQEQLRHTEQLRQLIFEFRAGSAELAARSKPVMAHASRASPSVPWVSRLAIF